MGDNRASVQGPPAVDMTNESLINDLSALLNEKVFHEQQRLRIETETVYRMVSEGSSVANAQRSADYFTLEHRLAIIELDAKIAILNLHVNHQH